MESQKQIINAFVRMIEHIANGKNKQLDFGGDDSVFTRGEIHLINLIGDRPGSFASELAREQNVTRAVIHKTLLKLEQRQLIKKTSDSANAILKRIDLTEAGQEAYRMHRAYHETNDHQFYQYLQSLDADAQQIVLGFLNAANQMIDHHF